MNLDTSNTEILRRGSYLYDREAAFDSLVRHAHDKLDAESCAIFLINPDNPNQLVLEATYCDLHRHKLAQGISVEIKAEPGSGLTGAIMYRGGVFRAHGEGLRLNAYVNGTPPYHLSDGVCHSVLAVPLEANNGERIGLLKLENKKLDGVPSSDREFLDEDVETARRLAEGIVHILDRRVRYEAFANALSTRVCVGQDFEFVTELLAASCITLKMKGGVLYRADYENRILRPIAFFGAAREGAESKYLFEESSLATNAFMLGDLLAPDPFVAPVNQSVREQSGIDGPLGGMQIRCGDGVMGAAVLWKAKGEAFTNEELRTASTLLRPVGRYLKEHEDARNAHMFHYSLIESTPAALFVKDASGKFLFCNEFFCNFFRTRLSDLLKKTDHDVFPKIFADKFSKDDQGVIRDGNKINTTERTWANGEPRVVQVVKTPLKSNTGQNIGVQGVFIDVTEATLVGTLVEAANVAKVGFWHWDIDYDSLYGSPEVYRIFEIPHTGHIRFPEDFLERAHPEDASNVRSEIEAKKQNPAAFERRFRIVRGDETISLLEIKGQPLLVGEKAREMLGYIRDITDYEILRQQEIQVAKLQATSDLANRIRHDLDNTLNTFQLGIASLREKIPRNQGNTQQLVAHLEVAVQTALRLTQQLNTMFGPENHQPAVLNVHEVIIEAINVERLKFEKAGISTSFKLLPDAPKVFANKSHLISIVTNLLRNACEACEGSPHKTVEVTVALKPKQTVAQPPESLETREVSIKITDTGRGLTPAQQKSVFKKGYTTKQQHSASNRGWGLYSCRRTAEIYGARVTVKNRDDGCKGAVAELFFPVMLNVL